MPSGMTKVEVFNLALDLVKDKAIISVDDPSSSARYLKRNFSHVARSIMRAYPWNFAKEFRELSADEARPAFKWYYSYTLPGGWMRVIPPTVNGHRFGAQIPHEIVGNKIYTNYPAPLRVILIMDKTANPGAWDDLFVAMVRCTLALGLANKFTSKGKYVELASQLLTQATLKAEEIDAFEGSPDPADGFDVIRVRGSADSEYAVNSTWR